MSCFPFENKLQVMHSPISPRPFSPTTWMPLVSFSKQFLYRLFAEMPDEETAMPVLLSMAKGPVG